MVRLALLVVLALTTDPARGLSLEPAPRPHAVYPRFDLTYLPDIYEQGLLGLRPVEIARYAKGPELEITKQVFMTLFSQVFSNAKTDAADPPEFDNIEQCVFNLQARVTVPTDCQQGTIYVGWRSPCVIRTVKPFDWDNLASKWFPKAVHRKLAGQTYLRAKVEFPPTVHERSQYEFVLGIFIPDERTLVVGDEEEIFELLDRLAENKQGPVPPPGWTEVDREFAAFTLDLRQEPPISGTVPKKKYPWAEDMHALLDSCQTLSFALSVSDQTTMRLVGTTKSAEDARTAKKSIQKLIEIAQDELEFEKTSVLKTFALQILTRARFENTDIVFAGGRVVPGHDTGFSLWTHADRNILELIMVLIHGQD